jgi:rhomboid protease GluP
MSIDRPTLPSQHPEPAPDSSRTDRTMEELPYPGCQVPPTSPQERPAPTGLRLQQPRRWKPTATWVIIAINVLVWAMMTLSGGSTNPQVLLRFGAKFNSLIQQGQLWRLVTPIFVHIGVVHLAFNLYAIYMIGPQIECFFGHARFLSVYLLSGIYGVLLSFAFSPNPAAGASGAIFGLIGTQAIFFYRYRNAFGQRGRRQFYGTLSIIAFNLVLTFTTPNIDIWGHVGGLLSGLALGWGLTPRYVVAVTETGPRLVDKNKPGRWRMAVLGAIVVLVASTWMALALGAAGM